MNQKIPLGLSYDDVLLIPQRSSISSRGQVGLSTQITPRVRLSVPLISVNMTDVTGIEMAIAMAKLGGLGLIPRFVSAEEQADMVAKVTKEAGLVGAAVGCRNGAMQRAEMLVKAGAKVLTLDVAHAHMQKALEATGELKRRFGSLVDIISGVVATKEGAQDLFKAGADSVRVGVGPGTICITRLVTGVGVPQISAVMQTAEVARRFKKTILCDGGAKNSGDIVKALAAGASAVVAGSLYAGTDEAPGEKIEKDGRLYKVYNASTSLTEKKNHIKNMGEVLPPNYSKQIEGVESIVPYKGPVAKVVENLTAGIRSGLSYSGAKNISELWKKARFIQVTSVGLKENGVHDVILTKSPYN